MLTDSVQPSHFIVVGKLIMYIEFAVTIVSEFLIAGELTCDCHGKVSTELRTIKFTQR